MTPDLETALAERLAHLSATLGTAESCTGGLIAHRLTNLPGASTWFVGGIVAYSNALKENLLAVSAPALVQHGAVSEVVANAMVAGLLARTGADWGIGVTGIAGPGGGTAEKPVGLVFIATGRAGDIRVVRHQFTGTRLQIKDQTASTALHQLLEMLPQ